MSDGFTTQSLNDYLSLSKHYTQAVGDAFAENSVNNGDLLQQAKNNIRSILLSDESGWPIGLLFSLRKAMEVKLHLNEASSEQWYLFYTIFESFRDDDKCKPVTDEGAWRSALQQAVVALNSNSFRHTLAAISRESAVAIAIRTLRNKGYRVLVDSRGALLPISEYRRLCIRIERQIVRAGGLHAANALLNLMLRVGRVQDRSLIHARTPKMVTYGKTRPGTPWHFLYSLCLKHLQVAGRPEIAEVSLSAMEDLAILMTTVIDVEPHSSFENMDLTGDALFDFLNETLTYDELFSFPQWQPLISKALLADWFHALEEEGCVLPLATAGQWADFSADLLSHAHEASLVQVGSAHLTSLHNSSADMNALFTACLSPPSGVNEEYNTPSDTSARTASYFPIVRGPEHNFMVQPCGVAARALCERVHTLMLNEAEVDLGNKMGGALERLTVDILESAGLSVTVCNGLYSNPDGGSDLEIDIVAETDDRIFLFECKKRH